MGLHNPGSLGFWIYWHRRIGLFGSGSLCYSEVYIRPYHGLQQGQMSFWDISYKALNNSWDN